MFASSRGTSSPSAPPLTAHSPSMITSIGRPRSRSSSGSRRRAYRRRESCRSGRSLSSPVPCDDRPTGDPRQPSPTRHPILDLNSTELVVSVPLDPSLRQLVHVGDRQKLPDGQTTTGTVSQIGAETAVASGQSPAGSSPTARAGRRRLLLPGEHWVAGECAGNDLTRPSRRCSRARPGAGRGRDHRHRPPHVLAVPSGAARAGQGGDAVAVRRAAPEPDRGHTRDLRRQPGPGSSRASGPGCGSRCPRHEPRDRAAHVHKQFGTAPAVAALRNISLTIEQGELVSVIGPSGSGKTTLLHVMGALLRPTTGIVRIGGTATSLSDPALSALRAHQLGSSSRTTS